MENRFVVTTNTKLEEIIIAACSHRVLALHGNISKAAKLLGISRQTLYKYLKLKDKLHM